MDSQRQQILWAMAIENYQAAELTAGQGWHNVSVACSYYAVFTAMWAALGDPPKGRWEHGGIIERFIHGQWRTPPLPVERELTRAMRRLYADRVDADYGVVRLTARESTASLATVQQVLRLVRDALGFSQEGIAL
jgi:uncharacterized protein (UPF0332 family)